ncbi:MAG: hypothetical protein KF691_09595 [Phycisphaeraceae bacterium]|nr:hypothetical protein [Phycisphaeraceae bacterium]
MSGSKVIAVCLAIFGLVHVLGMVWCISGGLDASRSDMAAFRAVTEPLKSRNEITEAGEKALEQNVEKRSKVHATVMFSYAAVHGVTAAALFAGAVLLWRSGRSRSVTNA